MWILAKMDFSLLKYIFLCMIIISLQMCLRNVNVRMSLLYCPNTIYISIQDHNRSLIVSQPHGYDCNNDDEGLQTILK